MPNQTKKIKKQVVYEIKAKLFFDMDDDIDINSYLDNLRSIGEAEVVDVYTEEVKGED